MRISGRRPGGKRLVAGIALLVGTDMSCRFACSCRPVVTGRTATRHHAAMVVASRDPGRGLVAFAAILDGSNVGCRLTGLARSVMAGAACLLKLVMAEERRNPAQRFMANAAILGNRDMRRWFHLGNHRTAAAMATGTGIRGALEHALDVAAFASRVGMDAGQGKRRLVVIEAHCRPGAFCRHQHHRENHQAEREHPSDQPCPLPCYHELHPPIIPQGYSARSGPPQKTPVSKGLSPRPKNNPSPTRDGLSATTNIQLILKEILCLKIETGIVSAPNGT